MAWTNEMIEHLRKMWEKGLTTNEIAKELGVSKNSIVGKVHRLNLESRPSPIRKKEDEEVLQKAAEAPEKESVEQVVSSEDTSKKISKIRINQIEVKSHKNTCLKLSELDSHTCRWPIGDPKDDNFCFCGKKVRSGQTYCDEHAAIAYVKPNKK